MDIEALIDCLREAFEHFGGVTRHVLFDNAKSVIIKRNYFGIDQHQWNGHLLEFSVQYGFSLRVCKPHRAHIKGKIERFLRYLKGSFVLPSQVTLRQSGLQLDSLLVNAIIGAWLNNIANVRVHGTTGLVPMAQLIIERSHLGVLPVDVVKPFRAPTPTLRAVPPITQYQHDLAIYDQLLDAL